jgi:hypothetical protein
VSAKQAAALRFCPVVARKAGRIHAVAVNSLETEDLLSIRRFGVFGARAMTAFAASATPVKLLIRLKNVMGILAKVAGYVLVADAAHFTAGVPCWKRGLLRAERRARGKQR